MKKRLLCLALVFTMAATQAVPVAASSRKQEIQAQKSETQSKLSAAESQVSSLESKKNELMGQINSTQQELVTIMTQIDMLKEEITDKEADIKETQEDLKEAEADRDEQYESMKKRIQYLYENGGTDSWAQILLESESITDMLSKIENNGKMYDYDREALEKMKAVVQQVQDLENQLMTEKAEQQDTLETKMANLKASASDYESQIATVKAQAQEYKNLIEQQNAELQQIQKEEEAAAKAAEEARKQAAAQAAQTSSSNNNSSSSGNASSGSTTGATGNTGNSSVSSSGGSTASSGSSSESSSESSDTSSDSSVSYDSATGAAVVAYASQFIGNPYVYGGNSLTNGIDCSGFTQQVFAHFGYSLPRTSDAQAYSGVGVSWEDHQAGDIIVYSGHVAILTGDGGIVHASNSAPYPQGGIKYTSNALYRSYIAIRRIVQ